MIFHHKLLRIIEETVFTNMLRPANSAISIAVRAWKTQNSTHLFSGRTLSITSFPFTCFHLPTRFLGDYSGECLTCAQGNLLQVTQTLALKPSVTTYPPHQPQQVPTSFPSSSSCLCHPLSPALAFQLHCACSGPLSP